MKLQYSTPTLLLAIFVVAVLLALFKPFEPLVTFDTTILPVSELEAASRFPVAIVRIKNHGIHSVWYQGNDGQATNFLFASDPESSKSSFFRSTENYSASWTQLKPGDTASAKFPVGNVTDQVYFAIELQDWRGRSAERSTGDLEVTGYLVN